MIKLHMYLLLHWNRFPSALEENIVQILSLLNLISWRAWVYKIFYCLANSSGRDSLRNYLLLDILVLPCALGEAIYLSSMKNLLWESILLILTLWKIGPDLRKLRFIFSRWRSNGTNTTWLLQGLPVLSNSSYNICNSRILVMT